MGTAFGLLILLMIIILVVAWAVGRFQGREEAQPASLDEEAEARDKALAAVIAVTAVLATTGPTDDTGAQAG